MNLAELNLTDGAILMMMGAAEANALKEPTKKTIFVEDLTSEEKAKIFKEQTGVIIMQNWIKLIVRIMLKGSAS